MFLLFALFSSNQLLYDAFGFVNVHPTIIGLIIILQYLFSPYNEVCYCGLLIIIKIFIKNYNIKNNINDDNNNFCVYDYEWTVAFSTFHLEVIYFWMLLNFALWGSLP